MRLVHDGGVVTVDHGARHLYVLSQHMLRITNHEPHRQKQAKGTSERPSAALELPAEKHRAHSATSLEVI